MPSPYIVRKFTEGTYHIYNRSVDELMFRDEDDYRTFLFYIYIYLKPLKQVQKTYPTLPFRLQVKNMSNELDAFAYCLLPNHFHLLIRQRDKEALPRFMKQLNNAYIEYYNKKYNRSGRLMHGRYRAAFIEKDEQILEMSRVIHYHPTLSHDLPADTYIWSSLREYLNQSLDTFCNKRLLLSYFSSPNQYLDYVTDYHALEQSITYLQSQIIERTLIRG